MILAKHLDADGPYVEREGETFTDAPLNSQIAYALEWQARNHGLRIPGAPYANVDHEAPKERWRWRMWWQENKDRLLAATGPGKALPNAGEPNEKAVAVSGELSTMPNAAAKSPIRLPENKDEGSSWWVAGAALALLMAGWIAWQRFRT